MEGYIGIVSRTLLLYILIVIIFRVMGKREIGELSLLDLVVFIMIGEMAAVAIENPNEPLIHSLVPMFLLVGVQILSALISLRSKPFRDLIDGQPSIIINKGKVDEDEMRKQRYNFDDLLHQLRDENIADITNVEYAILEPSGKLSVFQKKDKGKLSVPLIIDGAVQDDHLTKIGKSLYWLTEQLKAQGYQDLSEISLCTYQNNQLYIDIKDEK